MKKIVKLLPAVCLLLVALAIGAWIYADTLLKSPQAQERTLQKIQELTESTLTYQKIKSGSFPVPHVTLQDAEISFPVNVFTVKAEKIQLKLSILPLIFGKKEIGGIQISNANFQDTDSTSPLKELKRIDRFSLKTGAIRLHHMVPVRWVSSVGGVANALSVKGNVLVDSHEKWTWGQLGLHLTAELKNLPVADPQALSVLPGNSFLLKGGQVSGSLELHKKTQEPFLNVKSSGKIKELVYEVLHQTNWVRPPSMDGDFGLSGSWNYETEDLKLEKSFIRFPIGRIEANGELKASTREIRGMHISVSDIVLEKIMQYCPALENAIPFHIGFSGLSNWVISMQGTLDHLSLHLNCDLTRALLSYGNYFRKPKDLPFDLTFDYLVQNGKSLSGDFSVHFQEIGTKGNLTDLNLETGQGQLNLITNKFSLNGWEKFIPLLEKYRIQGDAKILANWKGDLRKLESAEHIFHVTIEKGSWVGTDGQGVQNAQLSFDVSPLMIEGKQMQFQVGNSPVVADLAVLNLQTQPQARIRVVSGEFDPLGVWQSVAALFPEIFKERSSEIYPQIRHSIEALFPAGKTARNFSVDMDYDTELWNIQNLRFEAYEGQADLKGSLDFRDDRFRYICEGEIRGLNLGLFVDRKAPAPKMLDGTTHLKLYLEGEGWGEEAWRRFLAGQGNMTVENGQFNDLDIPDALSRIRSFEKITEVIGDKDRKAFSQLDFKWDLKDGKLTTENLLLKKNENIIVDGEGTLGFDGLLNFRLDVFLPPVIAQELFPFLSRSFQKEENVYLGPIPILLSGPFEKPELKPDPAQVEILEDHIANERSDEVLLQLILQ